jgi:hypothetical protein
MRVHVLCANSRQTILTFIFFFGSEIFHPSYGFFNVQVPGTDEARALECVVGWEWYANPPRPRNILG